VRTELNIYRGELTYEAVARAQHLTFESAEKVLGMSPR
jgi:alanine dehydrogenase